MGCNNKKKKHSGNNKVLLKVENYADRHKFTLEIRKLKLESRGNKDNRK